MNSKNRILIMMVLLVLLASCAAGPKPNAAMQTEIVSLYQKAEAYYRNHFYARALETYQPVLVMDPHGDFADNALYKVAGIYMRQDQPEKAIAYFNRLQTEFPKSPYALEALYNKGYCYYKMGDPSRALETYKEYLSASGAQNKARAHALIAEAEAALGQYEEALNEYAAASGLEGDREKQAEILQGVKTLVEQRLPTSRLIEILPKVPEGIVADYVRYRVAQNASAAGDAAAAIKILGGIDFRRARFQFYKDAQTMLDTLVPAAAAVVPPTTTAGAVSASADRAQSAREPEDRRGATQPVKVPTLTIGVVLPLSGKFQVYGEQALHGIMLGVGSKDAKSPEVRVEVLVRDSEGDPEKAASAVKELAADERVKAIVGPLLVKESEPAADAAEQAGVPMLALSRKEELAAHRTWVFRNAVTFTHQAHALIEYAQTHLTDRRFAVMYPENEFGEAFRKAFASELRGDRATLSVQTSYAPDATDFRRQAHEILQGGGVDAVFIPDSADRVALIAPQLIYYGVTNVDLLGPSSWNDDALAQKAAPYLKRAVIVDGFYAEAADPSVREFSGRYQDEFGENPTLLSALGFDAVGMLARVAKSGNADTREAVRTGLLGIRAYPGVSGKTTFFENGETEKALFILQVGPEKIEIKY